MPEIVDENIMDFTQDVDSGSEDDIGDESNVGHDVPDAAGGPASGEQAASATTEVVNQGNDVSRIPEVFMVDEDEEAVAQSMIMAAMVDNDRNRSAMQKRYDNMPLKMLKLSTLEGLYQAKDRNRAIELLDSRHEIEIDEDYQIPVDNERPRRSMVVDKSAIDYQLTVANRMGLSALLLNAQSSHWYGFELNLASPYREFKGKHAMLGFDPRGKMLHIGRCNMEDVYLAMVPLKFFHGEIEEKRGKKKRESSVMSQRHYRQVVIMMAEFLEKATGGTYYLLLSAYEQDLDAEDPKFKEYTNIMTDPHNGKIILNFDKLKELDRVLVEGYNQWVKDLPASWKKDSFFESNKPIVVTSRYGQDAGIAFDGNEDDEAAAWQGLRDYSKISFLTVAIATSIGCKEIIGWTPRPMQEIKDNYPSPYFKVPHHGRDKRHQVKLRTFPLQDKDGNEIPIYDVDGDRVRRMEPIFESRRCGVLVNLSEIQGLFNANTASDANLQGRDHFVKVDAYPLAFLKSYGNIQANGVPHCLYLKLMDINKAVWKNYPGERRQRAPRHERDRDEDAMVESEGEEGEDEGAANQEAPIDFDRYASQPSLFQAVRPVSCQLYNLSSHSVAARAGARDTEQGTVTAAVAGKYARNAADKLKADGFTSYCGASFPSDRHDLRISTEGCPTECRAEFVYTIDVRLLKDQSGSSIYKNIILPLARAWNDPDVMNALSIKYLIAFKPKVFPDLFKWAAYPVASLIKLLYAKEMAVTSVDDFCPFRLELIAALERLLCFSHTGSTAVFATSVMSPLCITQSVIKHGFPTIGNVFYQGSLYSAMIFGWRINPSKWPAKGSYPAIASRRSQVLSYSVQHFTSYQAMFRMKFARAPGSVSIEKCLTFGDCNARALHICKVALEALFDDVRTLVADGVKRDISRRFRAVTSSTKRDAVASRAKSRMSSLNEWLKDEYPLGYGKANGRETFIALLMAISHTDAVIAGGLGDHKNADTSPASFAASLYKMSFPPKPAQPVAPVLQTGCFLPVLLVAHEQLLAIFESNEPSAQETFVKSSFVAAIKDMNIHFYPSPLPKQPGSSGAPNRKPAFNSWTFLAKMDGPPANSVSGPSSFNPPPPPPPETIAFENAIAQDRNAPWKTTNLDLNNIHTILNKASLPSDYNPSTSQFDYVKDTYEFVTREYRSYKTLHHLALIVAIIASKCFLPNLFVPHKMNNLFPPSITRTEVDRVYADMDWVTKTTGKGMKEQTVFIGMFTTLIIALYEERSPLRVEMAKRRHSGLGNEWTSKHSVKGMTYQTLIRIGLLWAQGPGAYSGGNFRGYYDPNNTSSGWGLKEPREIQDLYDRLCSKLRSVPFGPFDAVVLLVGDKNARKFISGLTYVVPTRPPPEDNIVYVDPDTIIEVDKDDVLDINVEYGIEDSDIDMLE